MNQNEAITAYLDESIEGPGISLLIAGLRDARQGYTNNAVWLGAIGYLIVCEQIGHTVARAETFTTPRDGSRAAFVAALRDFGPDYLDDTGRNALYDMRCAMAHRYGLFNEGKSSRVFAYTTSGPLLHLPESDWDGTIEGAMKLGMTTVVNLLELQNVIESMYATAGTLHEQGEVVLVQGVEPDEVPALLRMRIAGSLDELKQ